MAEPPTAENGPWIVRPRGDRNGNSAHARAKVEALVGLVTGCGEQAEVLASADGVVTVIEAYEMAPWGEVGRLRLDEAGSPVIDMVTCRTCGRSWNDALTTSITPVPSGRCPFEAGHKTEA
jgi:hypothetical protein